MRYKKQIDTVKKYIDELHDTKELLLAVQDRILKIEQQIGKIDDALPSDDDAARMAPGPEKAELYELFDLNDSAFDLIDEILGPPEDELTGEPTGTAFSPEARGNDTEISLEQVLKQFGAAGGKNNAS